MAKTTTDLDGSATIMLSDGYKLRIPGFIAVPNVAVQDVRNVTTALLELVSNLDERLAALEKKK